MIERIVKMTFEKGKADTFLEVFNRSKMQIASFPGCKSLKLLRDTKDDHVFFTYSIWDEESSLQNYRNSELFAITWSQTKPLFRDKASAWSVQLTDYVK